VLHFRFLTDGFRDSETKLAESVNRIHGHALANWIAGALSAKGFEVAEPWAEDHGWDFSIVHNGAKYLCSCSLAEDEDGDQPVAGPAEGHIVLARPQSLMDRLRGRNKLTPDEPVAAAIRSALKANPEVREPEEDLAA
jgi:hypothetical protein